MSNLNVRWSTTITKYGGLCWKKVKVASAFFVPIYNEKTGWHDVSTCEFVIQTLNKNVLCSRQYDLFSPEKRVDITLLHKRQFCFCITGWFGGGGNDDDDDDHGDATFFQSPASKSGYEGMGSRSLKFPWAQAQLSQTICCLTCERTYLPSVLTWPLVNALS